MQDLVRTFSDRPLVVIKDGWNVFISVHDQAYTDQRTVWRQKLANTHPDRGGSSREFRRIKKEYERWLAQETKWYSAFDLRPPTFGLALRDKISSAYIAFQIRDRLLTLLSDGKARTLLELAKDLNIGTLAVTGAVSRLRRQGAAIATISLNHVRAYQLLSMEGYKPPHATSAVRKVGTALGDGRSYSVDDLVRICGLTRGNVITSVCRLRKRGANIIESESRQYQLVEP